MKVVIAPNTFKNALPAGDVADALREGILQSGFKGKVACCPVGDGGDGTGKILRQHLNAKFGECNVVDALQRPLETGFGLTPDRSTAIIEMADASGLRLLGPRDYHPLIANTRGTGMLIKAAINAGVQNIILCIGGSATVDGGTGMMRELGVVFRNDSGGEITDLPLGLADLKSIDITNLDERLRDVNIQILCDVKNKLLGENGAAAVFGPQKGANEYDVKFLDECLTTLNHVVFATTGKRMNEMPHAGAAGGVAAALCAFCNAEAVDGITHFLSIINFDEEMNDADLVITGEGAIDRQTLEGKAPYGVAVAAKKFDIPVIAVAGKIEEDAELKKYFRELININEPGAPLEEAIRNTKQNLVKAGEGIGKWLLSIS